MALDFAMFVMFLLALSWGVSQFNKRNAVEKELERERNYSHAMGQALERARQVMLSLQDDMGPGRPGPSSERRRKA